MLLLDLFELFHQLLVDAINDLLDLADVLLQCVVAAGHVYSIELRICQNDSSAVKHLLFIQVEFDDVFLQTVNSSVEADFEGLAVRALKIIHPVLFLHQNGLDLDEVYIL